jgi:hypothetical protein
MDDALAKARESILAAQKVMARSVNSHRRPIDFQPGDSVWVSTKPWNTQRPSHKLDSQMAGPFQILEQVGHSYRIDFPASFKIHDVIPPDRLRKAATDPLPGQENPDPGLLQISGDNEWEVDRILAVKLQRGKLFYRVQ